MKQPQGSRRLLPISILVFLSFFAACHRGEPAAKHLPLHPVGAFPVPRARGPIQIDGQCREESWQFAFRSPPFEDANRNINPHAELRATADDDNLYVEVYVADIDIESKGDIVKLEVGPLHFDLMPRGTTAPAGVRTAIDCDDTIDNPGDNDEEWVYELAIPWSMLGTREVPIRALRIDVGRGGPPHAMAWPRSEPTVLRFDSKAGS
jgi:hypothetical protein